MFTVLLSKATQKDIKRLSIDVQKYIYDEILPSLKSDPRLNAGRLQGELSHLWKYGFTYNAVAYRIVFEIRDRELIVILFGVGTRENFYKVLLRRI